MRDVEIQISCIFVYDKLLNLNSGSMESRVEFYAGMNYLIN